MSQRYPSDALFHSGTLRAAEVALHLEELRASAERDRLARLARGPRPLRRRVGRLLIAAGQAMGGTAVPASAPCRGSLLG